MKPISAKAESPAGQYTARLNFPFLIGAYLAANAVSDACVLVDGSDCAVTKAELIANRHDLRSTLLDCGGRNRVLHTGVYTGNIAKGSEGRVEAVIADTLARFKPGAVFVASLPMCALTGIDYAAITESFKGGRTQCLVLDAGSLSGDWLDGYAAFWKAAAENIRIPRVKKARASAAIVGHMMDRTEGDHIGNLLELKRLLALSGVDLICAWPQNSTFSGLAEIARAGIIISLPYAREAARIIAGRTGADLVETGVPFGLEGTRNWLNEIVRAAGGRAAARRAGDVELGRAAASMQWLVRRYFAGRRVFLAGEPHLCKAVSGFLGELGCGISGAALMCMERHAGDLSALRTSSVLVEPPQLVYEDFLRAHAAETDLIISNSAGLLRGLKLPAMELGFPSYRYHALNPAPFLGYAGAAGFVERAANAAAAADLHAW